jgi:hypothetical protein
VARAARAPVFLVGILWSLTGLTLLLAVVAIQRSHEKLWSFLLLIVPVVLATLSLANLRRATRDPDEPV